MSSRRFHRPPGQFRPPGLRRLRRNHPAGTGRPFRRPAGDIFLGFSRRPSRRAVELGRAAAERSLRRSHKARHTERPAWAYGAAHAQPTPLSDIAIFRATSRSREIERPRERLQRLPIWPAFFEGLLEPFEGQCEGRRRRGYGRQVRERRAFSPIITFSASRLLLLGELSGQAAGSPVDVRRAAARPGTRRDPERRSRATAAGLLAALTRRA